MNFKGIDHFASIFKRAIKHRYQHKEIHLEKILLLVEGKDTMAIQNRAIDYFGQIDPGAKVEVLNIDGIDTWSALEQRIKAIEPSLIMAERLIKVTDKSFGHSLGVFLEALSQKLDIPLFVLPIDHKLEINNSGEVLVGTGHQYIDDPLIHFGTYFSKSSHRLLIIHVEDVDTFNYYMNAIERIPEIPSDLAREALIKELRNRPLDFMNQVKESISAIEPDLKIDIINQHGRIIDVYREILKSHKVNMIIFEADDNSQLAMHSIGYSIAIEFKDIPILLV